MWLALACTSTPAPTDTSSAPFADHALMQPGFLNVAHRGGGRLAPEHTLEAYANALQVGADVLECDVHSTADGALVCIHDDTVDRTTDGTGKVNDLTLAEIQQLDAAFSWDDLRGTGITIPTLDEALAAHPDVPWVIEIKQHDPPIEAQLLELLDAYDAVDRTALMSFTQLPMDAVRQDPRVLTAMTLTEVLDWLEGGPAAAPHAHVPLEQAGLELTAAHVERAHAEGVHVWIWTLNDEDELLHGLELDADAIYTDDPALLDELGG